METVQVSLGQRSYSIKIGTGILATIGKQLQRHNFRVGRIGLITDTTVAALYLGPLIDVLTAEGFEPVIVEIPPGEAQKNISSLQLIYDKLITARLDRDAPILALGGGVIGDLTGFAAATLQRGVPLVQIPTTLLSQVDSSVGGKTAVNHPHGKNLIGAFHQPSMVVIDVAALKSLPDREFVSGVAEVIKYGIILSPELFQSFEKNIDSLLAREDQILASVIRSCCQLKASVVQEDEKDSGYRSILNFGHTMGHAIENATGYKRFLHGEAVAIGMVFAAKLSEASGLCSTGTHDRIINLLAKAGLPVVLPTDIAHDRLRSGLSTDKKIAAGKVKFVCLKELGQTEFQFLSPEDIISHI